ncbi:ABC transporter transmembrane domain-containing protein [Nocardia amamiensis]|uniref:ABC transporter transmembrane domain-containing protein n=1 Tax=Nocardia amamiensis TaxID=404578 RepID=UPI000B1EE8EF|nr:ABC transporter transmembrane domain-containing protein [Nocardia amamiensis]
MSSRATAVKLVLRFYGREMAARKATTIPALLGPALGNICNLYIAPLIVAMVVGRVAVTGDTSFRALASYIFAFGGALLLAELLWRIGIHCLNRVDAYGIEHLYVIAMDELLAKDAAFFHNNFAGSLTKRSLSFAARFEQFVDTLAFEILAALVPLVFASVVLWRYNPVLVVVLMGMLVLTALVIMPLIQRRQKLVDDREAAIAQVSGHVADSLANMQVVRAFAAEPQEAAEHRRRVASSRRKSLRSWDYANLRIDTLVAPLLVLTNVIGLLIALGLSGGNAGVEAIVVAFTYYFNATGIMFRFNQIYRRLETVLTEAAQFTELLLDGRRCSISNIRNHCGPMASMCGSTE